MASPGLPFRVHATYSRDEISAGLLQVRKGKRMRTQGGVFRCDDSRADVLYVELEKDPKHYTPTTLYDDRAISPTLFQWEGEDDRGFTSPYLFLGPVRYRSHESEKPMRILWELEQPMPPEFFAEVKIAAR